MSLKQVPLPCSLGTLLFYSHPSMANGLSAVTLYLARKEERHRRKCDKIRALCFVESAHPESGTGVAQWPVYRPESNKGRARLLTMWQRGSIKMTWIFHRTKCHLLPNFAVYTSAFGRATKGTYTSAPP